jgi:SAM-dependent methyltransferase
MVDRKTVPFDAPVRAAPPRGGLENFLKDSCKRWPRLYGVLFATVGPSLLTGVTSRRFVGTLSPGVRVLHAGSGTRRLGPSAINLDVAPFKGVDLVADVRRLPFRGGVFDAVTCEQVIEHVDAPFDVAHELRRVTRPGGQIHVASPFLFPWHPAPSDYTRWTQEGLRSLFPDCRVIREGVMCGPFSALNAFLPAFLATILCFGSRGLQRVLQYLLLVVFSPVKLLDVLFARLPGAELCAANFFLIVRTPPG